MTILDRESDEKTLDLFFFPETKKKHNSASASWRSDFLSNSEAAQLEPLVEVMRAFAKGTQPTQRRPGLKAIMGTSWDWKATHANSVKRDFPRYAKATIVEEHRWMVYRGVVVTEKSVAHFRNAMKTRIAKHTLTTWQDGIAVQQWAFADGLEAVNLKSVPDLDGRRFAERLRSIEASNDGLTYVAEITEIIKFIEKHKVASADGIFGASEIELNVHLATERLVEVCLCHN
jgi:hypothetical protein